MGVQVNTPPLVITAPAGAPLRVKVKVSGGRSTSEAVAVKLSRVSSLMVWSPTGSKTGAVFTSLTVTVIVSVSLRLGVPSSVTTTVNT